MFIATLVLATALLTGGVQDDAAPAAAAAAPAPAPVVVERGVQPLPPVTEDELILGDVDAPVTIVAYTSLVCANCAAWHHEVLPAIIESEIATGRARLVMRQLPTDPRELSEVAAGIVHCAALENQMNVIGALFQEQKAMIDGGPVVDWYMAGIAASGRTKAEIEACLADPATIPALREVRAAGIAAGVTTMPEFFVNGALVASGSVEHIEAATAAAIAGPSGL